MIRSDRISWYNVISKLRQKKKNTDEVAETNQVQFVSFVIPDECFLAFSLGNSHFFFINPLCTLPETDNI